jgi:hypothetical protein
MTRAVGFSCRNFGADALDRPSTLGLIGAECSRRRSGSPPHCHVRIRERFGLHGGALLSAQRRKGSLSGW